MSSAALLRKFESEVELAPLPGAPNVHVIRPRVSKPPVENHAQMTDDDWDKFEADISAAFEQLP